MESRTITIPVDPQTAQAWNAADQQERRKAEVLVNLWLGELFAGEPPSLEKMMDEAGRKAKERGLTPEILESILKDR
jgi:pantoate kinase